jgi:hypothetical protein
MRAGPANRHRAQIIIRVGKPQTRPLIAEPVREAITPTVTVATALDWCPRPVLPADEAAHP